MVRRDTRAPDTRADRSLGRPVSRDRVASGDSGGPEMPVRLGPQPGPRHVPLETTPLVSPGWLAEGAGEAACAPSRVYKVLKGKAWVVDGDTLDLAGVRLRLFGIDAPELDHPHGVVAKRTLMRLCRGQLISAELVDEDGHGRAVARCLLPDGRDLSAEMVKAGLALDWPKFSAGCYAPLEVEGVRRKLWLAAARQKGQMHVWDSYAARKSEREAAKS